jgi:hypothetical protein
MFAARAAVKRRMCSMVMQTEDNGTAVAEVTEERELLQGRKSSKLSYKLVG